MNNRYKFLITGGSNTAITYVIYVALVSAGLNYRAALAVVYLIGIGLGFIVNRLWTFANTRTTKNKSTGKQLFRYILVYGLIFLINLVVLSLLVETFNLNPIVAQLFALCVSTVGSYFLQKTWVFKE